MAFADPMAITLATVAQSLPRISSGLAKSVYRKTDGSLLYTVSHQQNKLRTRSVACLDHVIDVNADLLPENLDVHVVIDRPVVGFTQTQVIDLATCLFSSLTASSNAGLIKMFGLET